MSSAPFGSRARIAEQLAGRNPQVVHVAKQLAFNHLPPHLAQVSALFCTLGLTACELVPDSEDLTYALRELVAAKDAMVRAALTDDD